MLPLLWSSQKLEIPPTQAASMQSLQVKELALLTLHIASDSWVHDFA